MRNSEVDVYLSQIIKNEYLIRHKKERYLELYAEARSLGGMSDGVRVQTSGNVSGKVSDVVCQYVDIEREIDELRRERESAIKLIERLPSDEYEVIYQLYVKGRLLKQICVDAGRSYEWGKSVKKRAFARIALMLGDKGY